ncbi:hypothetical protein GCM10009133_03180 [Cocleimonas flava]|jgi:uncharacterized protein YjeT (DUF2065 family)|uniref:DUF2065 domain-containing protein n=1 Tax=Cocleimonas flava TaxID=634765 RepID=A0A4R1EWX0_9GAMM|nr:MULTISPECIES: DUF2065 domain-containing protein [Cocleimonas]MEB8433643.1 DUF2065 domain-containing protein [Cocleimonas sp. KMM 6892]MEC4716454.1 DUF2065 domain-containing protein [Cocleimonas sp. KMM 6895]MEC4745653.1 DUF2065 domain-containing protein [Cocleimonas sp. KMM 6896]TCJ85290.1 hypothetical protein EV695_3260 [Cocleimonas flava]
MNWHDLLNAIALLLILEGLLPFIKPESIKKIYHTMSQTPESSLRMIGLASIVAGLVLLYLS